MKFTRRMKIILIVIGFVVIAAVCFFVWAETFPTIAKDAGKVYVGMPYKGVLAVWGEPVQITDHGDGWEQAYWDPVDGRFVVNLRYGKVTHKSAYEMEPVKFLWWRLRQKVRI